MEDILAVATVLPYLAMFFCTKNKRFWAWWKGAGILGTTTIAVGIVVTRSLLFFGVPRAFPDIPLGGIIPCVTLPIMFLGLSEAKLTVAIEKVFGYDSSPQEKMAWNDGLIPMQITLEKPLYFCVANFLLLWPGFVLVFWCKNRCSENRG